MVDNINNYCGCTGDTAEYTIKLNQQGPPGPQGPQGKDGIDGISPQIVVATSTPTEYILRVVTGFTSFTTPNLMADATEQIQELETRLTEQLEQINTNLDTKANKTLDNIPNPVTINGLKVQKLASGNLMLNANGPILTIDSLDAINMSTNGLAKVQVDTNAVTINDILNITSSTVTYNGNEIATKLDIPSIIDSFYIKAQYSEANKTYSLSPANLATTEELNSINTKVETNTSDINNLKTELPKIATVDSVGLVKPDGQTITIDSNGVLTGANQSEFDKYFTTSYDESTNILTVTQKKGSLYLKGYSEFRLETALGNKAGGLLVQGSSLQFYEDVPGMGSYFVGTKDGLYFNSSRLLTVDNLIAGTGIDISIADQYGNRTISATGSSVADIPIASATTLGGIKVGENLTIEADGTLNAQAGGGTTSADSIYGNAGYYSTHYGILDCPNGLIQYNATGTDVTVSAGIVLQCAGTTSKTTIASPISKSLTSTGRITLFYAGGDLLEAGKVDYQEDEPANDGIDNYQAWFKPSEGLWYFKSNDTGNVYRSITATPLANINIVDGNITRVDYIGYRILDDDILIHRAELDNLLSTIEDLTRRVTALENNINGGNA